MKSVYVVSLHHWIKFFLISLFLLTPFKIVKLCGENFNRFKNLFFFYDSIASSKIVWSHFLKSIYLREVCIVGFPLAIQQRTIHRLFRRHRNPEIEKKSIIFKFKGVHFKKIKWNLKKPNIFHRNKENKKDWYFLGLSQLFSKFTRFRKGLRFAEKTVFLLKVHCGKRNLKKPKYACFFTSPGTKK